MAFKKRMRHVTKNVVCGVFEATQELSKEELQILVILQWLSQQYKSVDSFEVAFDAATEISNKHLKNKTVCMERVNRVFRELNTLYI